MKRSTAWILACWICFTPVSVYAQEEAAALLGDVSGDAQIDAQDVRLLLEDTAQRGAGAGSSLPDGAFALADVDTDGTVTVRDAWLLAVYAEKTAGGMELPLTDYVRQALLPVQAADMPAYHGTPYVYVHRSIPYFDVTPAHIGEAFETYSELDSLGRCGSAFARISRETMPEEERGAIGMVKPSGWHTVKYDFVEGRYLYNRCHLIGYQLAGENANPLNLITGTRYLNTVGMLAFENRIAGYVQTTGNSVLYRVTPLFEDDQLLAQGVLLEAYSVEDRGKGICLAVYCYNVQPGVEIDYRTGESWAEGEAPPETEAFLPLTEPEDSTEESTAVREIPQEMTYVLNTRSKRFHLPDCDSVGKIKEKNKAEFTGTREELLEAGYQPCGSCQP